MAYEAIQNGEVIGTSETIVHPKQVGFNLKQLHRQPKKRKGYTLWKRSLQTSSTRS